MLLRFRVANYRSIRDEQELSFVATELNEGTAYEVPVRPSGNVRVLPVIGLYGSNASGKSNVLSALSHLGQLSSGWLRIDHESDRTILGWDPHVLDPATREQPTRYEVEFLADSIRYVYGLEFTDEAVNAEWLHAYPQGRRQVWFERDAASPDPLRFPDNHLGSTQSTLAELVRPDRPFISLANEVRHAKLAPIARWFDQLIALTASGFPSRLGETLVPLFTGEHGDRVIELLRRADQGIADAEIVDIEPSERDVARGLTRPRRELRLHHRGRSGPSPLALRFESDGTRAWLRILRPLLPMLAKGGVLIADELDGSLHPELAAETIRMFYDPRLNRHGAQLLFQLTTSAC